MRSLQDADVRDKPGHRVLNGGCYGSNAPRQISPARAQPSGGPQGRPLIFPPPPGGTEPPRVARPPRTWKPPGPPAMAARPVGRGNSAPRSKTPSSVHTDAV